MRKLILLMLIIPILELYILIRSSQTIGFGNTLIIVILTGVAGYYLAKTEGKLVIQDINREMARRNIPGDEILAGLSILIGGFLLLLPGFVTDIVGITMVLPVTRDFYRGYFKIRIENMIMKGYTRLRIRW
ncbi:FxsA family protein [Schnuerera sp. xch1]|uniref:FxsA family protein n=1 Tax=Schnuerera sp. xch1 TaxID=2874283 RepID=UPI001CBBD04D|nr:FxsA family protein [Schnuerera sp. xch1]MBZ2175651.1 FxsA family protein [Schnuerera sp. xch1]